MPGFTVPAHIDSLVIITVVLSLLSSLVTPFATAIYGVFNHETKR
jgi:hypothetical protein